MTKVSVLMPVYNAEQYLAQAIESILTQTYADWELIIVDDGSTDSSDEIISRYKDNRIYYAKNPCNKGLIYTRNRLIEMAGGEYVAFLDSDDLSLPDRLMIQSQFLDTNPQYALCGTWGKTINGEGKKGKKINMPVHSEAIKCSLLFISTFVQSSIMIRRQVLLQNPYDKDFPLAEDYELWCRLSRSYPLRNIPKHLTCYRWHETNISQSRKQHLDDLVKKIYKRELSLIGIDATDEDLDIHSSIRDRSVSDLSPDIVFSKTKPWLQKLTKAALESGQYDKDTLLATIAFRWIFLCKQYKRYGKILSFPVSLNMKAYRILFKTLCERL